MADDPRLTARGFAIGFAKYMSPEQVEGCRELDARSDLYSLAAVLYELITGRRPFQLKNQFQLMQAHLNEQVAPPSSSRSEIPPELDSIVIRGLSKERDRRFQTADEFRTALDEVRIIKSS
jgi:serine/threonine-protein kinase